MKTITMDLQEYEMFKKTVEEDLVCVSYDGQHYYLHSKHKDFTKELTERVSSLERGNRVLENRVLDRLTESFRSMTVKEFKKWSKENE